MSKYSELYPDIPTLSQLRLVSIVPRYIQLPSYEQVHHCVVLEAQGPAEALADVKTFFNGGWIQGTLSFIDDLLALPADETAGINFREEGHLLREGDWAYIWHSYGLERASARVAWTELHEVLCLNRQYLRQKAYFVPDIGAVKGLVRYELGRGFRVRLLPLD